MENERIEPPNHELVALTHMRKPSFAPEVDPSSLISADALFEALRSIQWSIGDSSQEAEDDYGREEPAQCSSSGAGASSDPVA